MCTGSVLIKNIKLVDYFSEYKLQYEFYSHQKVGYYHYSRNPLSSPKVADQPDF